MAKKIIHNKIINQINLLDEYKSFYLSQHTLVSNHMNNIKQHIENIDEMKSTTQLMGLEGYCSAEYFAAIRIILPNIGFNERNRRPPKDPLNSILSLGYSLLHNEIVLELYAHGLDPFIGFYHSLSYGRESLACDLVEPLRVVIDKMAIDLFLNNDLNRDLFYYQDIACYLAKEGNAIFFAKYEAIAQEIIRVQINDLIKNILTQISEQP